MRKIFTLFILLLLLPVTALAEGAAPDNLYVGDQDLPVGRDSYWTTSTDGKLITCEATNDWNVKYEPTSATLTLKNATIKGVVNAENIASAGIYAASSSGPVSLNIVLVGENEVTGGYGINVSSEGTASLSITGSGSLTVSATAANGIGIFVQAQSDANLTIDGANVNAVVTETNGRGVELSTGQAGDPNLTIEVKGGSLQASGQPNGIKFFTNANNTRANANLKVSGNAMVKTSGITTDADGSGSQGAVLTTEAGTGETGGIVWNGSEGTVYGSVTLQEDITIGEGESLTLDSGASLDAGDYDVIVDGGTLDENLANSLGNNVKYAPAITNHPQNVEVKENETATFTIVVTGTEPLSYQWQQSTDKGSSWMDITGETNASYTIATTTTYMNDTQYRCVVSNSAGSVESHAATLTVNAKPTYTITAVSSPAEGGTATADKTTAAAGETITLTATPSSGYYFVEWKVVPDNISIQENQFTMPAGDVEVQAVFGLSVTNITLDKTELSLYTGDSETLTATIEPDNATNKNVTWATSDDTVVTVQATGNGTAIVTAVGEGTTTITVTTEDGGKKATCTVTVTHSMVHTPKKDATCTEDGNIEYWYCKNCDKYFSDENATEELSDVVIPATGHHYVNGYCTKCGHRDPDYRPDPISYYNIYVEDVCDGVEVTTSKNVVREGGSVSVYVKKDTVNYTFDNFKVYYKRSYYGGWEELKEGTQPGEYPINNIWTHIYIKAQGAEEKEDPTGIESIEGVKVYTKDGSLYVQTPQREQVIIVSMSGAVVKNEEQVGLKQYHGLQPGIYIVRVGDRAYKLRLN